MEIIELTRGENDRVLVEAGSETEATFIKIGFSLPKKKSPPKPKKKAVKAK